jgi:6-pyruvoyltetrahydropterin/6-carboxytetrahydropterin synthase
MLVSRTYRFEAAHRLPNVHVTHKCHHMHGHNYKVEIIVDGDVDDRGFVIDFAEIDEVVAPLVSACDHKILNDVPGMENPTAELMAVWFFDRIRTSIKSVSRVRVYETSDCFAEYAP